MNVDEASTAPLFSIALRGGTAEVWLDRVRDAAGVYPLAQLAGALLVADPAAPPLPNGMPTPAVQLRLADRRAPVFTPANPQDAYRLLDVIFARRPDLRLPPPPPIPPYGPSAYYAALPGYVPGYPPGYQAPVPGYPGGQPDFTLAGLAHLSVFFAPIILPLIVWLTQRDKSPYIARQGKQAFFWHLIFSGGSVVLVIIFYALFFKSFDSFNRASIGDFGAFFGGFFIIWGIVLVLGIVDIVFGILGAVKAFKGEPFSYPLLGGL
jgi:uncharacterized Tic20 family protein